MIRDSEKDIIGGYNSGCVTLKISKFDSETTDYVVSSHTELIILLKILLI